MSKIDEKYIKSLETFTLSLEQIVETLKEQQKTNKADAVNEFFKAPMDNLVDVVKDLKKVTTEGFAKINNDNKEILKKIESIKQQKDSGSFDKIEDPKNKNKIVDGIKVVILIAAGVLALGMAFKIIGKVDFLSVMALSGAILIMSVAFSKISEIKNLTYANVFLISSILPIMSVGLLLSGFILKSFPIIGLKQGISMILIGATVGVASWFLLKSLKNVDIRRDWATILALPIMLPLISTGLLLSGFILKSFPIIGLMQGISMILVGATVGIASWFLLRSLKNISIRRDWATILALPIMLPLISAGLLASGFILKSFPIIGLMQGLSMILVSATIGIATLLLFKSIKGIDLNKHYATILALPIILPLIALGLVLSSYILQKFTSIKEPLALLKGSVVIGLSILFFTPTILLLGKMDLKQIGKGVIAIPLIAASIVATSWIFQFLPPKMVYPDWKWSLSVALSVGIFALIVVGVGVLATKFKKEFEAGLIGIVGIAAVIAVADYLISKGDYTKNPDWKWSLFTGLSIAVFGIIAFGVGFLANKDPEGFALGLIGIVGIAAAIFASDYLISKGDYTKHPSADWALGTGLSIGAFGLMSFGLGLVIVGTAGIGALGLAAGLIAVIAVAGTMLAVDKILSNGDFTKYPNVNWAAGVGASLAVFSLASVLSIPGAVLGKITEFFTGENPLIKIANNMIAIDKIFSQGDFTKYPTKDWSDNVTQAINAFSNIDVKANSIRNLADSFRDLSDSLKNINSFDNLSKISSGLVLLSVIDDAKLQIVLDKIKDNESTLKTIYGDNSSGILNFMERMIQPVQATITPESILSLKTTTDDSEIKKTNSKLDEISNKLSQLIDSMNQPTQAGSFN